MSAPRALMGAALALWGLSIGLPFVGIGLAVVLEAIRFASPPPSGAAVRKLVWVIRIVGLVAFAKLTYVLATGQVPQALYTWLRWLPVILLPLPMAQALAGGAIPAAAFLAAVRPGYKGTQEPRDLDTTYAFAAVTLVGAATGNAFERWFYAAAALLVAWALVARMPKRRWAGAIALIVAGSALGFGVQRGLWILQGQVEEWSTEMLQDFFAAKPDPFRERTRIGDLGRIKLGDRIVMRVEPVGPRPASVLLREAAFDRYYNGEWQSSKRAFRPVPRNADRWILREGDAPAQLRLRRSMPGGEGLLPLPAGAHAIDSLPADAVESLPNGTVRAKGVPRFISLGVSYDEGDGGAHDAADLSVPETLAPVLDRIIAAEGLKRASARETQAAIEGYFASRFSYSLILSDPAGAGRSRTLVDFLVRDHRGHCEYFATGTVLLLRRAGIPARYTVGYSAQEYSALEQAFVVRTRHAHAWTSAFVDGRWIAVDTTPSRWAEDEGEAARSIFGPALDFFSWLFDRALRWWLEASPGEIAVAAAGVLAVVLAVPAAILSARKWRRRSAGAAARAPDGIAKAWRGVEARLERDGHRRERGETLLAWARRLQREAHPAPWRDALLDLVRAYYRVRFDPSSPRSAQDDLIDSARRWRSGA